MAKKGPDIGALLSAQFALAHYEKKWFADLRSSLKGLTVKEALWKPKKTDHSVWQIAMHIHYWNNRFLVFFKGGDPGKWAGDNVDTFKISSAPDAKGLKTDLRKLDKQTKEFDTYIRKSKPSKFNEPLSENFKSPWYSILMNLSAHTAYHTGQIVLLRKMHKTWNAKKNGV
jgi:uncharacterized damage-inducible protein DinB